MGNYNWDLLCGLRAGLWSPSGGAAHFILDSAGSKLKINLISVVASDATFA